MTEEDEDRRQKVLMCNLAGFKVSVRQWLPGSRAAQLARDGYFCGSPKQPCKLLIFGDW